MSVAPFPKHGPYTGLDLESLPEDGKGHELEDGWLIELAPSAPPQLGLEEAGCPHRIGSGSERTDRVRKVEEYATLGVPQYWIVEWQPEPKVQVLVLEDGGYRLEQTVHAGSELPVVVEAEVPFKVAFDPRVLVE